MKKEYSLFLDSVFSYFVISLYRDSKIIDYFITKNNGGHADNGIMFIRNFLKKNKVQINNFKNIFLADGPGNFVGLRVTFSIVKTIKFIFPGINIYSASFLEIYRLFNINKKVAVQFTKKKILILDKKKYQVVFHSSENLIKEDNITDAIRILSKYFTKFRPNNKLIINYTV